MNKGPAVDGNEQSSILLKCCHARLMKHKGYCNLSRFRNAEKFVGDRKPAGAVKVHGAAVSQTKSRYVPVMLGYYARHRAVFQSYAARVGLASPIERASGTAWGTATQSESIMHGCLSAGITQCSGRVVTKGTCIDKNRLASD
jgi:hypothetical protein